MKILQVTPFLQQQYGGTERYCYNLSKYLSERGHEVEVYTTKLLNHKYDDSQNGFKVSRFTAPTVIWNINPLTFMLHKLMKSKFDIIHAHSHLYFTSLQTAVTRKIKRRTPMVLHLHGGLGPPPSYKFGFLKTTAKQVYDTIFAKFIIKNSDLVFSVSKHDLNYAINVFNLDKDKAILVPNAVDTTLFNPKENKLTNIYMDPEKKLRLIFIGDLEIWKGVEYLIEAVKLLKRKGINIELILVGEGSFKTHLKLISRDLPVRFLGQVEPEKIPQILKTVNIFVLPSLWEGFSTVVLEAMACGVPVIATKVGGMPELVINHINGILVEPKSSTQIADAIIELSLDQKLQRRIVENAINLIHTKYSFKVVTTFVEKLYKSIK